MKSFPFSLGKSKQNKFVSLATSAIAALALVGGVNAANATSIKVLTEKELTSESIPYNQKQPVVTQSVTRPIPYHAMG
ncbi:flotillin family protein, partial [Dolichospermum sp. ST_con]|nr:flotillin family protein [Dolichospermum sp. ST_con]